MRAKNLNNKIPEELLESILVNQGDNTEFTVIWLHGLGSDGNDFVPIVPELNLPESLRVNFIFPNAPIRPVTVNNGYEMRAWYDLLSLDRDKTANEDDILKSVTWINALIDDEIANGTAPEKILLAGFSQGGVIALHAGLRYPKKLAGIMALSTYIPFDDNLLSQVTDVQKGQTIFAAHGKSDPVIPFASWQDYVPKLEKAGFDVESHAYEMEHAVSAQEIVDISSWLQKVLAT